MLILKHFKTLQHVSIFIQVILRELIGSLLGRYVGLSLSPTYLPTLNVTHTKRYAAASPQLTFKKKKVNSVIFKFRGFNKEPTSSLKMI